ncbi:ABC transporter permease [Roseibium polysiphoniae]|uniref:Transport permease protein n=1 Tax=Roseibium polysiphoniae TaxID=2571221 RepID=A0A944CH36_9HYPH|nr:ABC transporter permease [Roseibium polysiphoniae]MBS8262798.1 ABC transporter permease [Roseibium polysiphoniae]
MIFTKLKKQFLVVSALVIREMATRYGTKIGGYAWAIIDPLAFVILLSLIFSAISRVPALGTNFPVFFAAGYMPFWIYRSMSDQIAGSITGNKHLLSYPIVHPYDTVFSRLILQLVTIFVVCIIIFSGIGHFIEPLPKLNMEKILVASGIAIMFGMGVGMINVVLFHMSSTYQQVFTIVNRPLFLLSGVFILPESIPHPYQDYLLWNPLVHIVAIFRQGFFGTYRALLVDFNWLLAVSVVTFWTGFMAIKLFDARLRESPS